MTPAPPPLCPLDAPGPLPGTTLLAAYGHTPGRLALLLESKGQRLLLWADLLHGLDLQAAHPEIAVGFDLDPAAAIAPGLGRLTPFRVVSAGGAESNQSLLGA